MKFKLLITEIKEHPFWSGVGILAAGTIASHALLFCTLPIIGFLYSPGQFGEFAFFGALLAFVGIVATLRYEMAIPIASSRKAAIALLTLALLGTAVVCMLIRVAEWLLHSQLTHLIPTTNWSELTIFLALGCAVEGSVRAIRAWNLRRSDMSALASAKVSQSAGVVICQLVLASLGHVGLYLSDIAGRLMAVLSHSYFAWRRKQLPNYRRISIGKLGGTAVRFRRYPLFSIWATLCIQFVDCSPLILLTAIYSPAIAGAFALAHRAVMGPLLFVSMAITQTYVAMGGETLRNNPAQFSALFWKTWKRALTIGGVSIAITTGIGALLVVTVLDQQWQQASVFMLLLAPAIFGQFVVGPVYQTLDLLQEQKWALAVNGLGMTLVIAVFSLAKLLQWPAAVTVGIYSAIVLSYNILLFACTVYAVRRFHAKYQLPIPRTFNQTATQVAA